MLIKLKVNEFYDLLSDNSIIWDSTNTEIALVRHLVNAIDMDDELYINGFLDIETINVVDSEMSFNELVAITTDLCDKTPVDFVIVTGISIIDLDYLTARQIFRNEGPNIFFIEE